MARAAATPAIINGQATSRQTPKTSIADEVRGIGGSIIIAVGCSGCGGGMTSSSTCTSRSESDAIIAKLEKLTRRHTPGPSYHHGSNISLHIIGYALSICRHLNLWWRDECPPFPPASGPGVHVSGNHGVVHGCKWVEIKQAVLMS